MSARWNDCSIRQVRAALMALSCLAAAAPATEGKAAPSRAPAAKVVAVAEARDPWTEARRLADAAAYDSALTVLRIDLLARPNDFALRWLEAGITGEAGRARESVALYERLVASHPDRAIELRADLAAQRFAAGDPAGASRDYRAWLAAHPDDDDAARSLARTLARADSLEAALALYGRLAAEDPSDREVALDRARVLGWAGRDRESAAAYRALLAQDSILAEARLGLAMAENRAGRHRRAGRMLERIAREPGTDPEAWKALALARYWDGDPVAARAALAEYRARVPGDPEAATLDRRIVGEYAPSLTAEAGRADDSDGLRVTTTGMSFQWPFLAGPTLLAGWTRHNVRDDAGTQDPLLISAGIRQRWNVAWTTYAEYGRMDWGDSTGTRDGGEAGFVVRPTDGVRLEAVVARGPVLTRRSLDQGITLLRWIGAVDLSFGRLSLHGSGSAGIYSDHNEVVRTSAGARLGVLSTPRFDLALRADLDQVNTRLDLDHGYYDPDFHREWGPGLDLEWRPESHWTLGSTVKSGWQRDKGTQAEPFVNAEGRIEWRPARVWSFAVEGGRGDSSLQSASGYRREWWRVAATRGW